MGFHGRAESDTQSSGVDPGVTNEGESKKYTVPTIYHVPTKKYMTDSTAIAIFLEDSYPSPPVTLSSAIGSEIETKARRAVIRAYQVSILPREINILSPRSQDYYRRTREAVLGHRLEDLLAPGREEECWRSLHDEIQAVGELILTCRGRGPFVLGATLSMTDCFIAGSLQAARMVDEGVFQRTMEYPGFREIYDACTPYM